MISDHLTSVVNCRCLWLKDVAKSACAGATLALRAGALAQPWRPAQLVETKRGKARSGQLVEQTQGEVAFLFSCRGEPPLVRVKFAKEAVVGLDSRVQIGQRRCWDGQGADVREVDFLGGTVS